MEISLADRMKKYETLYDYKLCPGIPFVVRLDGKGFSKRVKQWNCKKPFDLNFHQIMVKVSKKLFEEVSDSILIWTGSDEISIILNEADTLNPWFSKRINKILSLTAAIASSTFNLEAIKIMNDNYFNVLEYPAYFDSRIIQVPNLCEAYNNLLYRQRDCIKNSISGWARYFYSTKELQNKNSNEKIEMMKNKKFDFYNDAQKWSIYGETLFKTNVFYDTNTKEIDNIILDPYHCNTKYFNNDNVYLRKNIFSISESLNSYKLDKLKQLNLSADDLIFQDYNERDYEEFCSLESNVTLIQ